MDVSGLMSTHNKLPESKIPQYVTLPSVLLVCAAVAITVTDPLTDWFRDGEVTVTARLDPAGLVTDPPEEPVPELEPEPEPEPEPELEPLPDDGV
jgi:hypothetical protein